MEDVRQSCDGPRLASEPEVEMPPDFVTLRLLLQPGGLCVELNKPEMLVGRHSTAEVRLSLPDISRRHCRFVFGDGCWRVFDLNSLNGIYVNGERLHDATLFHGDRVRIGSLTFAVDISRDDATEPAHPKPLAA
jgi:pSer/pThr/pTyr-binding forkhead associated (FHA) protein